MDAERTRLKLELKSKGDAALVADMRLRLLGCVEERRSAGVFSAAVPVTTCELALAPEGARQLRDLQSRMPRRAGPGEFIFSVDAPFSKMPPGTQELTLWIDLKLRAADAYLPLIDGAKVRFKMA